MNDAWNPIDELEPLDDVSLGLLASFREADGPSADAEARMLAGLRARIEAQTEGQVHPQDPATAVSAETAPTTEPSGGNVRTLVVAAVAFAAGVALTLSLASPDAGPEGAASDTADTGNKSPVARRNPIDAPHPERISSARAPESATPMTVAVQADAELPWPLTITEIAELATLPTGDEDEAGKDDDEDVLPQSVELSDPAGVGDDDASRETARRRRSALGSDDDAFASRPSIRRRGPSGSEGSERRGSAVGAWAPSLNPAPAGPGIGSAARNPAVGGSAAPGSSGSAPSGSSPNGSNGSSDGAPGDSPPRDDAPKNDPPPQDSDPGEEPVEDELPPKKRKMSRPSRNSATPSCRSASPTPTRTVSGTMRAASTCKTSA